MTMQVNALSPAISTAISDAPTSADVSPDELFNYCESQINNVGGEVTSFFQKQQSNMTAKNSITDALAKLGTIQSKIGNNGSVDDPDDIQAVNQAIDAAAQSCPAIASQLADARDKLNTDLNGGTDARISGDEVKSIIGALNDASGQIDSDNQMLMIRMQSAMSAREQAIQLTTNMLQAISDSGTKVIGNIHA